MYCYINILICVYISDCVRLSYITYSCHNTFLAFTPMLLTLYPQQTVLGIYMNNPVHLSLHLSLFLVSAPPPILMDRFG